MEKRKDFKLGAVLTVTTGAMVAEGNKDEVWAFMNFVTGLELHLHQIPDAVEKCKSCILVQHPQLADVDASSVNPENHQDWMDKQTKKFGKELTIEQIPNF